MTQTDPIFKALWSLRYEDMEMKIKPVNNTMTYILQNEVMLNLASSVYAKTCSQGYNAKHWRRHNDGDSAIDEND